MRTIYITNSVVALPTEEYDYRVTEIDATTFLNIITDYYGSDAIVESAVGHQGTADAMNTILRDASPDIYLKLSRTFAGTVGHFNRIEIAEPAEQLVFKPRGRLPEGKVLSAEEIGEIGYQFLHVWLVRRAPQPSSCKTLADHDNCNYYINQMW